MSEAERKGPHSIYPAEACPYSGERFENQSGPEGPSGLGRRIWVDIRCSVGGRPRGICNRASWENWREVCADYQRARAEAWKADAGRLAERLGIHIHCPPCESTYDFCKYGQGHEGEASCATAAALAAHAKLKAGGAG